MSPANSRFELFIANRYLRAHRKQAVISIITVISVIGVAAGVMALVIALGVTTGFRNTLQRNLLSAMAHIDIMEKSPLHGIENWEEMAARVRKVPHVVAVAPALYMPVFLQGPLNSKGAIIKGIDVDAELAISSTLKHLKQGSLDLLRDPTAKPPGILLGSRLSEETGMVMNSQVSVINPSGELTPIGPHVVPHKFRVAGLYDTGFYEFDDVWTYTNLQAAQRALSLDDVVNQIEVNVDDLNRAPEIAKEIEKVIDPRYTTTTWQEQNKPILSALNMERIVAVIVISLIMLVAALNILVTLIMMVMEKYRDIAILMSMGATQSQIRRIFMLQGILIGVTGSAIGLTLGYSICYFANKYQLIRLPEAIYSVSFVPFEAHWEDGIWIAAAAILISFLATIYPAKSATRIAPAEVLRYE